jgi:hypothetical protein
MTFPADLDFCCLALKGSRLAAAGESAIFPGLTVSDEAPFKLEAFWVDWLGTIQAETFEQSTIYLTATREYRWQGRGEPVHEFLDRRVRILHHALILLGCGYNEAVLMVGGNTHGASWHSGPVRSGLTPCFRPYYRKYRRIGIQDLERAAKLVERLEFVFGHAPNPVFKRLRKGFKVWVRGTEEFEEFSEKLHSFVRATEAVLKPTLVRKRTRAEMKRAKKDKREFRPITSSFISRGQSLIEHSADSSALLGQLYDIRSSVEHSKDIMPRVKKPKGIDKKEAFEFRALQCEILADEIYIRILTTPALLEAFSTERKIEGFWSRSARSRSKLWGEVIDLDRLARDQFQSQILPDIL